MKKILSNIYCVVQSTGPEIAGVTMVAVDELPNLLDTHHQAPSSFVIFRHKNVPPSAVSGLKQVPLIKTIDKPVTFWEVDHAFKQSGVQPLFLLARLRVRLWRSGFPGTRALYRQYTQRRLSRLSKFKKNLFENDIRSRLISLKHMTETDYIPTYSLYIPTRREENISLILSNIQRQTLTAENIMIGVHGSPLYYDKLVRVTAELKGVEVIHITPEKTVGFVLNRLIEACKGNLVIKMDDDDIYGPLYVRDMLLTHLSTGAPVFGKAPEAVYFEKSDTSYVRDAGRRSRNIIVSPYNVFTGEARVSGATLGGLKQHFLNYPYDEEAQQSVDSATFERYKDMDFKVAIDEGSQVLTLREANKTGHRWKVSDEDLQKQAIFFSRGKSPLWSNVKVH